MRAIVLCVVMCAASARAVPELAVSVEEADVLFGPALSGKAGEALKARIEKRRAVCAGDDEAVRRCRIEGGLKELFGKDKAAASVAVDLFRKTGTVVGLLPEQVMDGQYRGMLRLVPRLPTGAHRRHLNEAAAALTGLDEFFVDLEARAAKATLGDPKRVSFRTRPLGLRFFESVKRRTPSAFAEGWTVSHNVSGSLFWSPRATADTYVHEIFHLNDEARAWWSARALKDVYGRIVARCGIDKACLTPYAPDGIVVKGGTYYAFMPDNGVIEYAADVGKRYVVEHRALFAGKAPKVPFRCATPENAEAWRLVVDEFFGGIDLLPPC